MTSRAKLFGVPLVAATLGLFANSMGCGTASAPHGQNNGGAGESHVAAAGGSSVEDEPFHPVAKLSAYWSEGFLELQPVLLMLRPGETTSIAALARAANGEPLSPQPTFQFESNASDVVTVNELGEVKAFAEGLGRITVSDADHRVASTEVQVVASPPSGAIAWSCSPAVQVIAIGASVPIQGHATDAAGAIVSDEVIVQSSSSGVRVSGDRAEGVASGVATLFGSVNGTALAGGCTVVVPSSAPPKNPPSSFECEPIVESYCWAWQAPLWFTQPGLAAPPLRVTSITTTLSCEHGSVRLDGHTRVGAPSDVEMTSDGVIAVEVDGAVRSAAAGETKLRLKSDGVICNTFSVGVGLDDWGDWGSENCNGTAVSVSLSEPSWSRYILTYEGSRDMRSVNGTPFGGWTALEDGSACGAGCENSSSAKLFGSSSGFFSGYQGTCEQTGQCVARWAVHVPCAFKEQSVPWIVNSNEISYGGCSFRRGGSSCKEPMPVCLVYPGTAACSRSKCPHSIECGDQLRAALAPNLEMAECSSCQDAKICCDDGCYPPDDVAACRKSCLDTYQECVRAAYAVACSCATERPVCDGLRETWCELGAAPGDHSE